MSVKYNSGSNVWAQNWVEGHNIKGKQCNMCVEAEVGEVINLDLLMKITSI